MGNSSSSNDTSSSSTPIISSTTDKTKTGDDNNNNNEVKVICLDCDKKNQKDLPTSDPVSAPNQPCSSFYETVCECMTKYEGQISSCTEEWDAFRKCHQQKQQQQQQQQ